MDKMTKGNVKGVSNVMTPGGVITRLHLYTCNRQLESVQHTANGKLCT